MPACPSSLWFSPRSPGLFFHGCSLKTNFYSQSYLYFHIDASYCKSRVHTMFIYKIFIACEISLTFVWSAIFFWRTVFFNVFNNIQVKFYVRLDTPPSPSLRRIDKNLWLIGKYIISVGKFYILLSYDLFSWYYIGIRTFIFMALGRLDRRNALVIKGCLLL